MRQLQQETCVATEVLVELYSQSLENGPAMAQIVLFQMSAAILGVIMLRG